MHEQTWGFRADKGVSVFKAKANSKFPQSRHFPLQEALRILGSKLFFECWSYFKLQTHYNYQQLTS